MTSCFFFFFNEIVICLNSQTRVNSLPCDCLNITSIWYLKHVCQNKPRKVFATVWPGIRIFTGPGLNLQGIMQFSCGRFSVSQVTRCQGKCSTKATGLCMQSGEGSQTYPETDVGKLLKEQNLYDFKMAIKKSSRAPRLRGDDPRTRW